MSIFGSIVNKIFGHAGAAAASTQASAGAPQPGGAPGSTGSSSFSPTTASFNNPSTAPAGPGSTTPASEASPAGSSAPGSAGHVDVAAILDGLAAKDAQKLDWRHSIVDMMKLLGLDSSLHARQELAKELRYSGSMDDSASMNIWLHKQVMQKLADNGGKVPDDLK